VIDTFASRRSASSDCISSFCASTAEAVWVEALVGGEKAKQRRSPAAPWPVSDRVASGTHSTWAL
jgi:hypothetical protein